MLKCANCGKTLKEKPKEILKTLGKEVFCEECQDILIRYIEKLQKKEMTRKNIFSQRLKQLRESAKLTQEELANILGISRGAISYYEKSERKPDIDVLVKICEYFNVSSDWILGLNNENKTLCLNMAHSKFIQNRFNRKY